LLIIQKIKLNFPNIPSVTGCFSSGGQLAVISALSDYCLDKTCCGNRICADGVIIVMTKIKFL